MGKLLPAATVATVLEQQQKTKENCCCYCWLRNKLYDSSKRQTGMLNGESVRVGGGKEIPIATAMIGSRH
jgi:hypothetical protein